VRDYHALQRKLSWAIQPQVLFPAVALFFLAVIWGATLSLIRVKSSLATQAAEVSSRELLDTYEAQVVRALREIDQTLTLVKYWHERGGERRPLSQLKDFGLLPPELLFTVSATNRDGVVIDSTASLVGENVAQQEGFLRQRDGETFFIGRLPKGPTGNAKLSFSRRLSDADGTFDGVVMVAVDAAYFVSGYETSSLGEHGVMGLVGSDGVFRVRRSGDALVSGDIIPYASMVSTGDASDSVRLSTDSLDGIRRWSVARELYGFPLAIVVGLSADEQLAPARLEARRYLALASMVSVVVTLIMALLGRMSWQLAQGRLRESYLAYHDGLTGLPNRSMFSKLLSQNLSEAHRYQRQLAVAFLDLDGFKQINDTLGHEAGDELLKEVAVRLRGCVRESDAVARLGGDEFVVVLPELKDVHHAADVARKILTAIAKPFTLIGQEFRVTASIGISTYPADGLDEQALTKHADVAMYHAKEEGKNNFQFYSEKLNTHSLERLTLESSLRHALERGEFRLHYQAKRDIASGHVTGMEALLRWEHPDLGTVVPMRFLPIAEETGLIVPIGKWVLKTACAQNVAWQQEGLPALTMAVNLSVHQFRDEGLVRDIQAILASTGMDPALLELEISEKLLTHDIERTLQILTALKAQSVRIAIDDFGTGYASLATLQRFPLDTIKIDRSFIRDLAMTPTLGDTGLADAIIAMGKSLSLTVVAQGVETRAQAEFLRTHACDELQGFYFKKPLPADQFARLLHAQDEQLTYTGKRLAL
jgi:diguanylate cyclase (GGDEF)-like protein